MRTRLSDSYSQTYEAQLEAISTLGPSQPKLACLWPQQGIAYDGELLVCGRATNGWADSSRDCVYSREGFDPAHCADPAIRLEIMQDSRSRSEEAEGCPLAWIAASEGSETGYNSSRSKFIGAARRIVSQVLGPMSGPEDASWASSIVWTNLYKVAPADEGNPSESLQSVQWPFAATLLGMEIAETKPRRVLAMTGWAWFEPFAAELGLTTTRRAERWVEATAVSGGTHWVITKHPAVRESGLRLDDLADDVVGAFAEA